MKSKILKIWILILIPFFISCSPKNATPQYPANFSAKNGQTTGGYGKILVGAMQPEQYLPMLKGKRVGLVVNQTSMVNNTTHLVDFLISKQIKIEKIFAPEHGFRGNADAGEKVNNEIDAKTGISVVSIYGKKRKPDAKDLENIDVLVFDIQDVGVRFYTYISTLQYVMEASAALNKPLIIFDRPNPNGHYVDGPMLDTAKYRSFIGMQPIPIVYGMTIGEYASMLNGEKMLTDGVKCNLNVVKCKQYTHNTFFELPVKPSPNLPNIRAILLYPSLCFFEGTDVSVGRGTAKQFQIYGAPTYHNVGKNGFSFTPMPFEGAKEPPQQGKLCFGRDLSNEDVKKLYAEKSINLFYLRDAYERNTPKDSFFLKTNFFEKLSGNDNLRKQLVEQKSAAEIRATWTADLKKFKAIRQKYLMYR